MNAFPLMSYFLKTGLSLSALSLSIRMCGVFLFFSDELFFFDGVTSGLFLISHVNIRLGVGFIRSCLYGEVGAY